MTTREIIALTLLVTLAAAFLAAETAIIAGFLKERSRKRKAKRFNELNGKLRMTDAELVEWHDLFEEIYGYRVD